MMKQSAFTQHLFYGLFGLLLGVVLSISGFSNYDEVHKMFTFQDFNLLLIFAGAVGMSMLLFAFMPQARRSARKPFTKGTIPGAILFGWGWAMTGACPAVALVQLGEGQLAALWTLFGILSGVWFYRALAGRAFRSDNAVCGEE